MLSFVQSRIYWQDFLVLQRKCSLIKCFLPSMQIQSCYLINCFAIPLSCHQKKNHAKFNTVVKKIKTSSQALQSHFLATKKNHTKFNTVVKRPSQSPNREDPARKSEALATSQKEEEKDFSSRRRFRKKSVLTNYRWLARCCQLNSAWML